MGRKRTITQSSTGDENTEEGTSKRSKLHEEKENVTNNCSSAITSLQSTQPSVRRAIKLKDLEQRAEANLRSGKIKKIYLQNFMCHGNFEVNLNKCINIIVGLNGSGKSAILTAIAIGLGGRAASTARSTNLKELVRRGEPSASIEITLTNDGIDSYEHDVFGDEIIIVRNINANSGASTYKLKSQNGKVVSTSRQDLIKMSMCLNIQVENPVLILNQDAARSFLKECDPKKLYEFFMKATQIEAIIEKLNACFQTAVSSKNQLVNIEKAIKKYEHDIDEMKQKHTRLQSVKQLKNRIEEYKNELNWLKVTEVEKELELVNGNLAVKREEVRKISDLINNKEKYEKENREKIRELGTTYQQLQFDFGNKDAQYDNAKKEYEQERDKLSSFENTFKGYNDRLLKKSIPNIRQLEQDIAEHENNPSNNDNLRLENEQKIAEVEKKINDNSALLANSKRDFQMFMQTLTENKEQLDEINNQNRREQERIGQINHQISTYQNAGKDTLSVYGASVGRLLKELEQLFKKKKFTRLPKAFLGRYIEVPDKKYRGAVETILRNVLTSFIVNCDQDRLVLSEVLKKYDDIKRCPIITTEFINQVYDVRQGLVRLQSPGAILFNVIKVSDPVVMNCLIDQCKIERIVLVENIDDAINLTQDEQQVPRNLFRVLLLNPMSEYYPAPNYRSYSVRQQPSRYIQTNFNELIRDLERQRQVIEGKCEAIKKRHQQAASSVQEFQRHVNDKKKLMADLHRKENHLTRELQELKSVEFPENTDIDFLRKQLDEEKTTKDRLEKKIEDSREKLETRRSIVERFKHIMDQELDMQRQSRDKMRQVQTEIDALNKKSQTMKNDIDTKGRLIKNLQDEENACLQQARDLEGKVKDMTKKIKGKRVPCNHTEDHLKKNILMHEKRILGIESSNENIEEVQALLNSKIEQLDSTKSIYAALDNVLKKLTSLRESRYLYVRKLRQHMSVRMKHKFHQLMSLRSYSAEIEIDHKERKLQLKVIPRDSEIEDAVSNTKALSGGERSYSTVSFLLSLWSCVDHPFYFLDEYDVFSDEYNRHIMTKLLLNEADKKKDKQFGFLTPQEFSNVEASETISIHKLQDPERRN